MCFKSETSHLDLGENRLKNSFRRYKSFRYTVLEYPLELLDVLDSCQLSVVGRLLVLGVSMLKFL